MTIKNNTPKFRKANAQVNNKENKELTLQSEIVPVNVLTRLFS